MLKNRDFYTAFGVYGAAGIQLAIAVVGGLMLGNYVDRRLKTSPLFTIVGLILGGVGGFLNLFRMIKWFERKRRGRED